MQKTILIFIMFIVSFSYGYSGGNHKTISRKAIDFLISTEPYAKKLYTQSISGRTYDSNIVYFADEPDLDGLTNDDVNNNSDLDNYNYDNKIETCLTNVASLFFQTLAPFCPLPPTTPITGMIGISSMKALVKGEITSIISDHQSDVDKLRRATQHTYVVRDALGQNFSDISVAPYCAQAEYNMAISKWNTDRAESLRRLGRVLHYVQDLTVPHHLSLTVNIPDVCRAVVQSLRQYANIDANSSQYKYETTAVKDYLLTYQPANVANYKTDLIINSASSLSIPNELIGFSNTIYTSDYMGKVDGYSISGGLAKVTSFGDIWKRFWDMLTDHQQNEVLNAFAEAINEIKTNLINAALDEAANRIESMVEENMNKNYSYRNINDDMNGTAQTLVPKAILESAKIIDKFLRDVDFKETNYTSIQMVRIPGNIIQKAYMTSSTEVTQGLYGSLTGKYPSYFQTPKDLDLPVESITHFDAILFCNSRSLIDRLEPVYSFDMPAVIDYMGGNCINLNNLAADILKNGYRLPTPTEWEYAYMANTTTPNYWGSSDINLYCWNSYNSVNSTRPVGLQQPNTWNIYDIAGNVEEMTCTYSSPMIFGYAGGCYLNPRSSGRFYHNSNLTNTPSLKYTWLGFRIVRKAPPDLTPIINLLLD